MAIVPLVVSAAWAAMFWCARRQRMHRDAKRTALLAAQARRIVEWHSSFGRGPHGETRSLEWARLQLAALGEGE